MIEPTLVVSGNVAVAPTLREVAGGRAVARFRLAHTPRRHDRVTDVWSDGVTLWLNVSCWRALAEHTAQSLKVGDRVVVTGKLTAEAWRGADGVDRSGLHVEATSVGFDLTRTAATAVRPVPLTLTSDPGDPADGLPPVDEAAGPGADVEEGEDEDGLLLGGSRLDDGSPGGTATAAA